MNFDATPALQADANVSRAKDLCLGFYEQAVRSTNLLCAYFEEIDSLTQWGDGEDSPTLSAKGKRIHRRYSELAPAFARQLERAYLGNGGGGSRRAMNELGKNGRRNITEEMECQGFSNEAPGLLLVGLAAQSAREQQETYEKLQFALRQIAEHTHLFSERPLLGLQKSFGIGKGGQSSELMIQRIAFSRLEGPDLLRLGMAEIPSTPALERYYAQALGRSEKSSGELATTLPKMGRSLASSRCAK